MKRLSQCILAAHQRADDAETPVPKGSLENYNYKNLNSSSYNYKKPASPAAHRRYQGAELYRLVNTDPMLKQGLAWGMSGGLLFNLCQAHGLETVQRSIAFVARLREAKRNGRYCRTVILNGGPKGVSG